MLRFLLLLIAPLPVAGYTDTWKSLDSRPLPEWYDDAKFGIFLHWGVFSVPSIGTEWFWYRWNDPKYPQFAAFVNETETSRFSYQDYAQRFIAELYRPDEWANIFANAGAQYVVLTSKHHEGYCMWDSRDVPTTWGWNAMEVGPKRDLLGDLAKAVKKQTSPYSGKKVKFGVYHSLFEFYNLLYLKDKENNFTTHDFPKLKTLPELYDLVKKYEPEIIWSDGAWDASCDYWQPLTFLAWLANNSTVKDTVVWNDRWGKDTKCKHGSYLTCSDRYKPNSVQSKKWESCYTITHSSWGFNRNASIEEYYTVKDLIVTLIDTVSLNGNLLLNVGPASDGTIPIIFVDRLLGIGEWLRVNGEAIYATRPWSVQQQNKSASLYYTMNKNSSTVYAIVTEWPKFNRLYLEAPRPLPETQVSMLGVEGSIPWTLTTQGMEVIVPALTPDLIPCQHAWVFSLKKLENIEMSKLVQ